ncbi:MAG: hypothetical protein ACI9KE_002842 [Polyangiales bacterium]|jgi:hypothetical protein
MVPTAGTGSTSASSAVVFDASDSSVTQVDSPHLGHAGDGDLFRWQIERCGVHRTNQGTASLNTPWVGGGSSTRLRHRARRHRARRHRRRRDPDQYLHRRSSPAPGAPSQTNSTLILPAHGIPKYEFSSKNMRTSGSPTRERVRAALHRETCRSRSRGGPSFRCPQAGLSHYAPASGRRRSGPRCP